MTDLRNRPLSDLTVEDGTRPKGPSFGPLTAAQRQRGQHLAAIHRHYLSDLSRIRRVMHRIEAGDSPPAALRDIILAADMTQNLRAFGTICGEGCRILSMHHNIEEQMMFPELSQKGNNELRAVIERLQSEHEVVHELLERLAQAADALIKHPDAVQFQQTAEVFDRLETVVRSHFGYEETNLEEALAFLDIAI